MQIIKLLATSIIVLTASGCSAPLVDVISNNFEQKEYSTPVKCQGIDSTDISRKLYFNSVNVSLTGNVYFKHDGIIDNAYRYSEFSPEIIINIVCESEIDYDKIKQVKLKNIELIQDPAYFVNF